MLEITDLHVYYGGIHAVKGVSLRIPEGKVVSLVGANGAGKSSTVRAVSGLVRGKGGILFKGETQVLGKAPEDIVRLGIALSPEGRRIFPHLSVEENLRLGAYIRDDEDGIARDMAWIYDIFPRLRERSWQAGGTLSGGEQQMLAVGRALMCSPELLMFDEPSLGLAPILVREMFEIIKYLSNIGKTVLLIEQNAFAALSISDHAYIMETGAVVLEGPGEELLHNPSVKEAYLGG